MLKKNRKFILVSLVLMIDIIFCIFLYHNFNCIHNSKEEQLAIEEFFEDDSNKNIEPSVDKNDKSISKNNYDYIAILEIPKIGLKKGLVNEDSIYNNISYNVQIIKPSQMPNVENSNLILASHSGNSRVSYFRYLYKLEKKDIVILNYEGVKYTYEISNIYREDKNGTIVVHKNISKNTLTLTTCDQKDKSKQIIIICELVRADRY